MSPALRGFFFPVAREKEHPITNPETFPEMNPPGNDFQGQPNESSLHAIDYWQVIKNRYGIILLTFLLVFLAAAVITYVMPKKYESRAKLQLLFSVNEMNPFDRSGMAPGTPRSMRFFQTEFKKITSEKNLEKVCDVLDLSARWNKPRKEVVKTLQGIVTADVERDADIIEIRVRYKNAADARDIAAAVAEQYQELRKEREINRAKAALDALEGELTQQIDLTAEKKKALDTMMQVMGRPYYQETASGGSRYAYRMESKENREATELHEAKKALDQLRVQVKNIEEYKDEQLIQYAVGLDLPEGLAVRKLDQNYREQEDELVNVRLSGLGELHPDVLAYKNRIGTTKKQLDDSVVTLRGVLRAQLDLAEKRYTQAEKVAEKTKQEVLADALKSSDFFQAKQAYEKEQTLLDAMRMEHSTKRISLKLPREPMEMTEEAKLEEQPVSPNIPLHLILGAVMGLIFGTAIAFFLEYLDTSVRSLEDVERYLQVPVLAVVPKDVGLLHKQSGLSPDSEAYRILRTNIEFNRKNPEDNSFTVVSGGASEGKSTTLANLAYVCAQGGYTTLMIDADLRRPRLHTFFDINNSVGLTNYLTTDLMLEDVILQTPIDNLFFMPSGVLPADAAGILNSRRMSEMIQDVKQRFDLVLVDSPPILGVSDASVLASEVDLTMIVVQHRKLPRNMLLRVKQAVENVGGHIIGVVLNNVDVRSDSQYQYYTSYYTYYAPSADHDAPSQKVAKSSAPAASKEEELY